ncbi:MAG: 2-oxoglutarate dehydrogenase complex dihydrolipoyllysine-residue succinyltransferase [Thiotrichaceae bacterium]|nr:2-oxoglutarate dehydrogenase complex dihydrolipoyllysine-residue succinyltransferase [Thiotrichaceae bacterium]
MNREIRVPLLPESVMDATIGTVLKQVGESVLEEEPLLDLEMDKVVLDVPSPCNGIVQKVFVESGDVVVADQLIVVIKEQVQVEEPLGETPVASPSVRKVMYENDVTMDQVHATGEKSRVLKSDVDDVVHQRVKTESLMPKAPPAPVASASVHRYGTDRSERRVPMSRLRQRVAERLVEAQQTAAILTTFNEVDLSDLVRLRKTYQERFQHAHGIKLGFMSFFVKAATEALKRHPEVNARIEHNDIIYHGYYDIGVAVSTERGLVVPIIRDTDQLGHADIEKSIADFAGRARDSKLEMDELTGGTFSISNGGVFGSMLSTPILNPPQSAILGMHKIEQRAVVRDDKIVIRPMMYLALSYDHRIIDGKTAVGFLMKIKDLLEDPASLLLEL